MMAGDGRLPERGTQGADVFCAYNTQGYPANRQILLDLLATRQEIASILGFRSLGDLATATR